MRSHEAATTTAAAAAAAADGLPPCPPIPSSGTPSASDSAVPRTSKDYECEAEMLSESSPLLLGLRGSTHEEAGAGQTDSPYLNKTSPARFWAIFSQILAALLLANFDSTVMASSHPIITSHFQAANAASWLSTGFLLTFTACQPLVGRLSDALGRKPLFVGGLAIFAAATTCCALAPSIETLILARALCGVGAGCTMSAGSILISDLVPIERRATFQAYINITFGIGAASGAAMGGAMAESMGWRWEFGVQVPPMVLCIMVSSMAIPSDIGVQDHHKSLKQILREFDTRGSVLLTCTLSFLVLAMSLGGNIYSWSHPYVLVCLGIAAVSGPAFIWAETQASKPVMPFDIIRTSPRGNLIIANFIGSVLSNAILFNVPLYFQAVLLETATSSGLRLVVPMIAASSMGTLTGFAITYTRRLKWAPISGACLYVAGTLALALLRRELPSPVYYLALVPFALGQGMQFPGSIMAVLAASTSAEQAVATSIISLWRSLGFILGIALSSLAMQNGLKYYLDLYVTGSHKAEIIDLVRKSVEAVADVQEPMREQVVQAYEAALRLTFAACVLLAVVSLLILIPIKVARLPGKTR